MNKQNAKAAAFDSVRLRACDPDWPGLGRHRHRSGVGLQPALAHGRHPHRVRRPFGRHESHADHWWGFNPTSWATCCIRAAPLIMTRPFRRLGLQDRPVQHRRAGPVHHGSRFAFIALCAIPFRAMPWYRSRLAGGRCWARHLGRDPRPVQGPAQHQRGARLHHDQLDRRVSGEPGSGDISNLRRPPSRTKTGYIYKTT